MDDVDRQIIDVLRRSARSTYAELARTVGLSAPAVHDRVSKLEAQGVITGYHAAVDPSAVGLGVTALVGVYEGEFSADLDLVGELRGMSEVEDCLYVAGDESFVLKVRVANMAELESALTRIARMRGVARTRSTVVLSTRWEGRVGGRTSEPVHDGVDTPSDPGVENDGDD